MTGDHYDVDVAVIGAGVVGLAVARELAEAGWSVFVLERNDGPGRETSSRNSEVIHAGIYYPTGSLKARLCVEGNRLLYRFCQQYGVEHRAITKLIIALDDTDLHELSRLKSLGEANGVPGLQLLDEQEVSRLEPRIKTRGALLSPTTGIIDSHGLIKTLEAETQRRGGQILYSCAVTRIEPEHQGYSLILQNPSGEERLTSKWVVNATGLEADRVAASAGLPHYRLWWCKGDYFTVQGPATKHVSRLIYPVPSHHLRSLGVHITLDLAGRMRLGPDATYIDREHASYLVDDQKAKNFYDAVRLFLPFIKIEDIHPEMAGIRPKLQGPSDEWMDFSIMDETHSGYHGFVNLVGIESPGLTSCLAIAHYVHALLKKYK